MCLGGRSVCRLSNTVYIHCTILLRIICITSLLYFLYHFVTVWQINETTQPVLDCWCVGVRVLGVCVCWTVGVLVCVCWVCVCVGCVCVGCVCVLGVCVCWVCACVGCVCVLGVCWVCVCVGCVCRASACWVGVSTPFCLFCLSSSPACLPPNSTAVVLLYFPKQQITLLSVMQIRIRTDPYHSRTVGSGSRRHNDRTCTGIPAK